MPDGKSTPDSPTKRTVLVKKREAGENLIVLALEKGGLETVVKVLRNLRGSGDIRKTLNKIHPRNPVNRFTHARWHAVKNYPKQHGRTPANLMVSIIENIRTDAHRGVAIPYGA